MTSPELGFGSRLRSLMAARGQLCVGIDPHATLLNGWGVGDTPAGCEKFALTVVDALGDRVPVIKPQSAFFERFGSAGIAVLERTIRAARDAGALVLLDGKRGDIGSTAQAYAEAYLDPAGPLHSDALTVHPYLGFGSLDPFVETAQAGGSGVFVVTLTSNPEGVEVQHAVGASGRTVAQNIIDTVGALNSAEMDAGAAWGSVGVVVGATIGRTAHDLSRLCGPILAPGLGAQGATPADLREVFGGQLGDVLPAVSRELLRNGPDIASLRSAADAMSDELRRVLTG